jgi:hypothetical protein
VAETRYLSVLDVEALHVFIMEKTGGPPAARLMPYRDMNAEATSDAMASSTSVSPMPASAMGGMPAR